MDEITAPSPDLSLATLVVLDYALEPEISVGHATSTAPCRRFCLDAMSAKR